MRRALLLSGVLLASLAPGMVSAGCQDAQVEFRGPGLRARFSVEVAATQAEREHGLMDRKTMPAASGMLFLYAQPEHARFWMKDTLIPLDMVFVNPTGVVVRVKANAIPEDLSVIDGGPNVSAVVEINGGLAARLGIVPGAEMRSPAMDQAQAVWRCDAP